jgi:hypothetical protein
MSCATIQLRIGAALIVSAMIAAGLSFAEAPQAHAALAHAAFSGCPDPQKVLYPHRPFRGTIRAAKRASYRHGKVLKVTRGLRAPRAYRLQAKGECGRSVVGKSVYVQVHPRGESCTACDFHSFVVHHRTSRRWEVWTAF